MLELLAAWLGMTTDPEMSQNLFQWAMSYPLCVIPQSQLDVLLNAWQELYPQGMHCIFPTVRLSFASSQSIMRVVGSGSNHRHTHLLLPADLKRKSSENLPVDSKQLKTAEPLPIAAVLSSGSASPAAQELLLCSADDQPDHWQVEVVQDLCQS